MRKYLLAILFSLFLFPHILLAEDISRGKTIFAQGDATSPVVPYQVNVDHTDNADGTITILGASGAPSTATYLTSTANGSLSNEVDLGSLSTGLLKGTVAGGVSTISSITDSSSNWDTAYTDRLKWDGGATGLVAATGRTSLGLDIGTNVQAYDADLTTWAGITPGANVGTFLATPSSANLLAAVTDETGSGVAVFGTSPIFTTQITTPKIVSAGDTTIDAVNAAANSTVYITNSNGTYAADLNVEGNLVVTDVTVSTGGTLQLGQNGTDGILKIYSEQGATDYIASLYANTAMTSAASFYLPADEPAGESFLKMGTDGIIDYDTNTYLTSLTGAVLTDQSTPQTIGATGARLTKLWATDITTTNAISGDITGNAATVTTATIGTNASYYPMFAAATTGSQSLGGDADLTYNPSTNTLTATTFVGALTGTASGNLVSGGALGTPSSATLTNATALPVSGITPSTSTALGVGSIELGHASDTTITRTAAGAIAVEGVGVPLETTSTDYAGTSTIVGWSNISSKTIYYKKIGLIVFVQFYIEGTSNATTVSFTLPIANQLNTVYNNVATYDNGTQTTTGGKLNMNGGGNFTCTVDKDMSGAAWTNSGTKVAAGQFWYVTS